MFQAWNAVLMMSVLQRLELAEARTVKNLSVVIIMMSFSELPYFYT